MDPCGTPENNGFESDRDFFVHNLYFAIKKK